MVKDTKKADGSVDIVSLQDYYPGGMDMPGRSFTGTQYTFGYQGSLKADELGLNQYTTYFRELDCRIMRWASPDPVNHPWQSPYLVMNGNPIALIDPMGNETDGGGTNQAVTIPGSVSVKVTETVVEKIQTVELKPVTITVTKPSLLSTVWSGVKSVAASVVQNFVQAKNWVDSKAESFFVGNEVDRAVNKKYEDERINKPYLYEKQKQFKIGNSENSQIPKSFNKKPTLDPGVAAVTEIVGGLTNNKAIAVVGVYNSASNAQKDLVDLNGGNGSFLINLIDLGNNTVSGASSLDVVFGTAEAIQPEIPIICAGVGHVISDYKALHPDPPPKFGENITGKKQ